MTEDLQKRAMAVDYAVKLMANIGSFEAPATTSEFMLYVEAIYNFLNGETK